MEALSKRLGTPEALSKSSSQTPLSCPGLIAPYRSIIPAAQRQQRRLWWRGEEGARCPNPQRPRPAPHPMARPPPRPAPHPLRACLSRVSQEQRRRASWVCVPPLEGGDKHHDGHLHAHGPPRRPTRPQTCPVPPRPPPLSLLSRRYCSFGQKEIRSTFIALDSAQT